MSIKWLDEKKLAEPNKKAPRSYCTKNGHIVRREDTPPLKQEILYMSL